MKNNAHRMGFKPMTASNITAASPVVPKIYPYSTPGVTYYNNVPWPEVGESSFSRVEGECVENVLDRINKIDRIGDDENPDNPVNPVKKTLHG